MKTASGAAQALTLARAELFDLYLLDNRLPNLPGVELCRQLRAFDTNTPVIFCSGAAYETDRQEALEAGAQLYFTRPVDFQQLQDAFAQLIFASEMRSLEAMAAGLAAVSETICERVGWAEQKLGEAREAMLKATAFHRFIAAGGTRGHFERLWPGVLLSACPAPNASEPA